MEHKNKIPNTFCPITLEECNENCRFLVIDTKCAIASIAESLAASTTLTVKEP